MKTTLLLLRHGATASNLAKPAKLQGLNHNPPLDGIGVRQATVTRDYLAIETIHACYTSPLQRAIQTAAIIAEPHNLKPVPLEALIECNVGDWEGKSWEEIRETEPDAYHAFMRNPAKNGYGGGENFAEVYDRVSVAINELFDKHPGLCILVVAHHVVNRTYLASTIGLPISQARRISLENCGISIVVREDNKMTVKTLNSAFHLRGVTVP
ncbi:MAG: histidine phosphatase family protein [Gemmataceae bacterium]